MNARVLALSMLFALTGCAAANPFRLEDQISLYHDDLRWGRMSAAEQQVASTARVRFQRTHAHWGTEVQVMDLELEGARISGLTGMVRARYTWTRAADPDVRETVVETRWRAGMHGSWTLEEERVVAGDPSLLAARTTQPRAFNGSSYSTR